MEKIIGNILKGRGGQQAVGSRGLFVGRSGKYGRRGGFLLPALAIGGGIAAGLALVNKL